MSIFYTFVRASVSKTFTEEQHQVALDALSSLGDENFDIQKATDGHSFEIEINDAVAYNRAVETLRDLREKFNGHAIDVLMTNTAVRSGLKLAVFDMDKTVIDAETLDHVAALAEEKYGFKGVGTEIAKITQQAMAGDLDFAQALHARVALLDGLTVEALEEALAETKSRYSDGIQTLIATLKAQGVKCVLISGGFTYFTGPVAKDIGFDKHYGNVLEIKDEKLTGHVLDNNFCEGVLGKETKRDIVQQLMYDMNLQPEQVMVAGDGANDGLMLLEAGFPVGHHAKPNLLEGLPALSDIRHTDFTAVLHALGVKREIWTNEFPSADVA